MNGRAPGADAGSVRTGPGRRALAYWSADRAFALINDYEAHRAELVTGPDPEVLTVEFANAGPSGAGHPGPRPVPPTEEVGGYGTFTFPYGPLDAGVPEAARFDVRTYGERILTLSPVAGYKHRGLAASIVGLPVVEAALRIERLAGTVSASHVAAFLAAAESAVGRPVAAADLWLRALLEEVQRLWNHLRAIAREAEAAAQPVAAAQLHALAEEVLRAQGAAFGHRWGFGALLPRAPIPAPGASERRALETRIDRIVREFARLWELLGDSRIFIDRIQTTAPVDRARAVAWGAVGPTLRASDVAWDDRVHAADPPYDDLFVTVPRQSEGDALARVVVRAEEIRASGLLVEQLVHRWPTASATADPRPPIADGRGLARVEAPSGDLVYDVTLAGDRVARVAWRSPTEANLPVFARALEGAVFTDFPFAFESFGLVFAEWDG